MAATERQFLKRKHSSRSSSQSSLDAELNTNDRLCAKTVPSQSPMSLAQIISATYKHSPNLLIPHPAFLKLLKTVGARGEKIVGETEVYTIQQLCFYLKEYIKGKQLYDINDVHVVYCVGDPLGDVFKVERFTIHEVLNLISKTCIPLIVSSHKIISPASSSLKYSVPEVAKHVEGYKFSYVGGSQADSCIEKHLSESSPKRSASLVNLSRHFSKHGNREIKTSCDIVTSTTDTLHRIESVTSVEKECEEGPQCPKKFCLVGKSLPVSAEEEQELPKNDGLMSRNGLSENWLQNLMQKDVAAFFEEEFSDVESIYSIQSKETAVVKDSSDDLWFLKEDEGDIDYNTDNFSDIYADEYDIASDFSSESPSNYEEDDDCNVFTQHEGLLMVREGSSETEFADGELSDAEESQMSQRHGENSLLLWQCLKCQHRNRTPDRLCDKCLNLRTEELLHGESPASSSLKLDTKHHVARESSSTTDSQQDYCLKPLVQSVPDSPRTRTDIHIVQPEPLLLTSELDPPNDSAEELDLNLNDSMHQFMASQESGFFSFDSDDATALVTVASKPDSLMTETLKAKEESGQSESGTASLNQLATANLCIICLSEPKVASLIHGSSGHQACCYQCACQLKRMRKPCPVCRRPIQRVIRNYVL